MRHLEKIMVSLATSEFWWILPTCGMKSSFCSRCPKVSGNTNCKWSWRIRWMPLEIRYGDEKGLTARFFFLPFPDGLFYGTVVPHDLLGKKHSIFLWCSWPAWEHTILYLLSILPYFISSLPRSYCSKLYLTINLSIYMFATGYFPGNFIYENFNL